MDIKIYQEVSINILDIKYWWENLIKTYGNIRKKITLKHNKISNNILIKVVFIVELKNTQWKFWKRKHIKIYQNS